MAKFTIRFATVGGCPADKSVEGVSRIEVVDGDEVLAVIYRPDSPAYPGLYIETFDQVTVVPNPAPGEDPSPDGPSS